MLGQETNLTQAPVVNSNLTDTYPLTKTPLLLKTPRPTLYRVSSPTHWPTFTITPTPVGISANYDLPFWISDPGSTIGVMITESEGNNCIFTFYNFATQDSFNISISIDFISGYFWMPDGAHFGFLSKDSTKIILIDIVNGNVEQYPISDNAVRFVSLESGGLKELFAYGKIQDDNFILLRYPRDFSANLHNFAWIDWTNAQNSTIFVENLLSGEINQITETLDGYRYNYSFSWSPVSSYLAILKDGQDVMRGPFYAGQKIEIYTHAGEKLTSFDGNFIN
jgi:hypothetical protein